MSVDRQFIERNHAATARIHKLAEQLTDDQMLLPVGPHWKVSIVFAHLAFWDRRVLHVLEKTEQDGKLNPGGAVEVVANDLSLPFWAAVPPREAVRLAIETAEQLDKRLETFPPALLEEIYAHYSGWVERSNHRNGHLNEVDAVTGLNTDPNH